MICTHGLSPGARLRVVRTSRGVCSGRFGRTDRACRRGRSKQSTALGAQRMRYMESRGKTVLSTDFACFVPNYQHVTHTWISFLCLCLTYRQAYETGDGHIRGISRVLKRGRVTWYALQPKQTTAASCGAGHIRCCCSVWSVRTILKVQLYHSQQQISLVQVCRMPEAWRNHGLSLGCLSALLPQVLCSTGRLHLLSWAVSHSMQGACSSVHH